MSDYPEIGKIEKPSRDELLSFKEYAEKYGCSYETPRRIVAANKNDPDLSDEHIFTIDRTRYLDKVAEEAINRLRDNKQNTTVVINEKSQEYKKLEAQNNELQEENKRLYVEITKHRDTIDALKDKLLAFQQDPSLALDTSKYILLEDHKKVEEELQKKEGEIKKLSSTITDLEDKNKQQADDLEALKGVTLKNVELSKKNDETLKEIEKKREEIREVQEKADEMKRKLSDTEIERDKINLEKEKLLADAEIQRKRAEQEYEEALKLGFFARRRKLKELQRRREEEQ